MDHGVSTPTAHFVLSLGTMLVCRAIVDDDGRERMLRFLGHSLPEMVLLGQAFRDAISK